MDNGDAPQRHFGESGTTDSVVCGEFSMKRAASSLQPLANIFAKQRANREGRSILD